MSGFFVLLAILGMFVWSMLEKRRQRDPVSNPVSDRLVPRTGSAPVPRRLNPLVVWRVDFNPSRRAAPAKIDYLAPYWPKDIPR